MMRPIVSLILMLAFAWGVCMLLAFALMRGK